VINIINTVYQRVLFQLGILYQNEILLLQYGSSYFQADNTKESDFDILIVAKLVDMQNFMGHYRGILGGLKVSEMRTHFFFG
jgi:hypothetical protein